MKKEKKIIFFTSLVLSVFFISLSFYSDFLYEYCYVKSNYSSWKDILDSAIPMLVAFCSIITLFFSLITYFLKDQIFKSWTKFTYVWTPLSIVLVFITPRDSGGGFFPSLIDGELIAIVMLGLYFIISSIIIVWKSIKIYWFKKNN